MFTGDFTSSSEHFLTRFSKFRLTSCTVSRVLGRILDAPRGTPTCIRPCTLTPGVALNPKGSLHAVNDPGSHTVNGVGSID